jgi:hypothetical protein
MHGVAAMLRLHGKPAAGEDGEHAVVLREDLRLEAGQAICPGDGGQVLEQDAGNPLTVVVFLVRKCRLFEASNSV